jgi:hypothetical protein
MLVCPLLVLFSSTLACNLTRVGEATPAPTGKPAAVLPEASATPEATPGPASIRGVLWHDTCQFTGGEAGQVPVLGKGCARWGTLAEQFGPNQERDDFETGWAGVTIHLGAGVCPSIGLAVSVTDAEGGYRFENLAAGAYCVSYNPGADGNDKILIPGAPTFPERGDAGAFQSVILTAGDSKKVDFGYAWQFYN